MLYTTVINIYHRYIDQWIRIENSEIDPNKHAQVVFDRDAKVVFDRDAKAIQ